MNFSTSQRVLQTIRAGDEVEWTRGENRVKINNAANCVPPLDPEVAKKLGIKINVNWGELMILMAHARRQYLSAFWGTPYFFKVTLPFAPKENQSEWGGFITERINHYMRNSLSYFELHRSRWASVVAHGPGPQIWEKSDRWLPRFLAVEDLRIATDTTVDFDLNLGWFAARHIYTPFELCKDAFSNGPKAANWNKKKIAAILKTYKEINYDYAPNHYDWETTPEKFAELIKQDGGYYSSDAMPGIPLWHFYFQDLDENGDEQWFMRIVPENGYVKGTPSPDEFLWSSDRPWAPNWKQILHCQSGDLNNKAPFLWHAQRSLGFALLEPTFYTNITRCRMLQHLHDQFNVWLRVTDPAEKARATVQEFANFGVLKSGVSVVGAQERHQVDSNFVELALAQLKQLQQEASSTYTQEADTGTSREQTAFETSVKMQQVNAMTSGLILTSSMYAKQEYMEICRRFTIRGSSDPNVKEFLADAAKLKGLNDYMAVSKWAIEPQLPIGMGNPALAQANSQQLMAIRPAFDEEAQQEILHEATLVLTGDPRKAARWVPLGRNKAMTDSERDAQVIFGTLMQGVIVKPREGLSKAEQIDTLIPMMAGVITRLEQRDNTGTPDEIAGLKTVAEYIFTLMSVLANDPNRKEQVKKWGDDLGKLMNQVKGLEQRGAEKLQQQAGPGMDPMAMAKVRAMMMTTRAKIKSKELSDRQRGNQRSEEFTREQRRRDAETYHEIQRDKLKNLSTFATSNNNGD